MDPSRTGFLAWGHGGHLLEVRPAGGTACRSPAPRRPTWSCTQRPATTTTWPHDLVHFFVEQHFGLRDGIFGQLAAGGDAHTFVDPSGSMRERRKMKARNASQRR